MQDSRLTESNVLITDASRALADALKLVEEIREELSSCKPEFDLIDESCAWLLTARKAIELAHQHIRRAGLGVAR